MDLPELFDCPVAPGRVRMTAAGCAAYQKRVRDQERKQNPIYPTATRVETPYECPEDCPRNETKEDQMSQSKPAETKETKPIGDQIRARRTALGWSQIDLAREAGVSPWTLGQIERGPAQPSAKTKKKIENALAELEAAEARAVEAEDGRICGTCGAEAKGPDDLAEWKGSLTCTACVERSVSDDPEEPAGGIYTCAICGKEEAEFEGPTGGDEPLPINWSRVLTGLAGMDPACEMCAQGVIEAQGKRLWAAREAAGLTIIEAVSGDKAEAAMRIEIEAGRVILNPERLHKLAQDYGVNPLWIATGKGPREAQEEGSAEVSPAEKEGLVGEIRSFEPEVTIEIQKYAEANAHPIRFFYSGPVSGLMEALDRWGEMVQGRRAA